MGITKGVDLLKQSAPRAEIPFKPWIHMTEKDRPRGKPYKEWNEKDAEENDSNIN
jgi:hypothetical protein